MRKAILLLVLFLGIVDLCYSQLRYRDSLFDVQVQQDVLYASADPYGPVNMQDLRMDIYTPIGDTQLYRPTIVFAFGGGFLGGMKRQPNIPQFCETFAQRGFVVAAIDYRTGFNVIDPGSAERAVFRAVQDMRAACRYLAGNYQTYQIDTGSFILAGTSAGCFTGLHSTFMDDSEKPGSVYGILLEPEDLGCGNCSGNLDYNGRSPGVIAVFNQWGAIVDTSFIDDFPRDSVPVISFHGTGDLAVPYRTGNPFFYPLFPVVDGSEVIHQRLDNLGVFNQLVPFPGAGHEPQLTNQSIRDTIFKAGSAFLYEVLRPKPGTISGPKAICQFDTGAWLLPVKAGIDVLWYLDSALVDVNEGQLLLASIDTGVHRLFAWAENRHGAKSYAGAFSFYVHPAAKAGFSLSTLDSFAIVVDSSSLGQVVYSWGDGLLSSDSIHAYASQGTFQILQTVDRGFCRDTISRTIEIDFCPIAQFAFTPFNNGFLFEDRSIYADSSYWNFGDGSPIVSSNNPFHQYANAGTYTAVLTAIDANCTDTARIELTSLGTGLASESYLDIQVFPNPLEDAFTISGSTSEQVVVRLFNSLGEVVLERQDVSLPAQIEIPGSLPAGIYIVELRSPNELRSIKLIKE